MNMETVTAKAKEGMQTYSFDQAYQAALAYFKGDELAARVWVSKYALKDSYGYIYEQDPDQMHRRIAREIARIEAKYANPMSVEQVYGLLREFRYVVPQGSPMSGIGNPFQIASLSNCFVIGHDNPADSYGGIMKIDQEQVQLMKRRGGVGHDLSHIRPTGSPVFNSALTSTGIVPFMERYSNSTREVAQDGRRGALMMTISVKHPDAERFIDAKLEQGKVTGANVSVRITDEFMRAVVEGKSFTQQFPIDSKTPEYVKEIDARKLWGKIIHNAWKSAEPGVLYWDTVIRESVADSYADLGFRTVTTNPCGEIPLCPNDSCRLLAINLYSYVKEPFTARARFDFDEFRQHVGMALRVMDDIIDLELEKIEMILAKIEADPEDPDVKKIERDLWLRIREKALKGRRTGVGITAEGDMLAALGLRYGSENAIDFSVEVHKATALAAYRSSVELAKERGAFPLYDSRREEANPFVQRLREADPGLYADMARHGRRNIALLTIAPTGTTSIMTQTTSGIEPVFLPYYKRRTKINPSDKMAKADFVDEVGDSWQEFNVFHHHFLTWAQVNGHDPERLKTLDDDSIQALIAQSPYHKATSNDVDWVSKVKMQGAVQQWVDHSISVTINLPNDVTEELVDQLYVTAWESGCKGCTVYRDGSRSGVLVSNTKEKKKDEDLGRKKRPESLEAEVIRFQNNNEKWIAFIGLRQDGTPYEIFTGLDEYEVLPIPKSIKHGKISKVKLEDGSKRYDFSYTNKNGYEVSVQGLSHKFNPEYWNYAKLISGLLRHEMPIPKVVNMISTLHLNSEAINTWKNGVERALKKFIPDGTKAKAKCAACNSTNVVYQEGCLICKDCGSSKCG